MLLASVGGSITLVSTNIYSAVNITYRAHIEEKMLDYMVIYPRGNRSKLAVAQVRDYEREEWALASRRTFGDDREAAVEYMIELADRHGLSYEGQQHYLD